MRIGILGTKGTTLDILHNLRPRITFNISNVVRLDRSSKAVDKIAYYQGDAIEA